MHADVSKTKKIWTNAIIVRLAARCGADYTKDLITFDVNWAAMSDQIIALARLLRVCAKTLRKLLLSVESHKASGLMDVPADLEHVADRLFEAYGREPPPDPRR